MNEVSSMKIKFFLAYLSLPLFVSVNKLQGDASDPKQDQNVSNVVQQAVGQHEEQDIVTKKALKTAFLNYLLQFDPNRIYLLQTDVIPFKNVSDQELTTLLKQYNNKDYSVFIRINEVVVGSIFRVRRLREELEGDPTLIIEAEKGTLADADESYLTFAQNEEELQKRIRLKMIRYLIGEMDLLGKSEVLDHPNLALDRFEAKARLFEDRYLYKDEASNPLSFAQQRSLFVMHVLNSFSSTE